MTQVNIQDAKTHLSRLISRVEAGEQIILARGGIPVARLAPLSDAPDRELGFVAVSIAGDAWAPLSDDELDAWS